MALRIDCASALSCPAMSKAVPWSGEVRTFDSPAVKFTPSGGGPPLGVVHGQDAVVAGVAAPGEKPVGRKGAERQDPLSVGFDDGGLDDLLFLGA